MNRKEAARLVAAIMAACPGQSVRLNEDRATSMVDTYTALLEDLSYEQCNAAVHVLLQTRTWMPSVADIRATVLEIQRGPVSAGAEAWGEVLAEMGRPPSLRRGFNDPITARVVAALSWRELCNSENTVADRARFIEAYDKLAAQHRKEQTSPLLGAARDVRERIGGPQSIASLLPGVPDGD